MPCAVNRVDLILSDRRCYTFEAHAAAHVSQFFDKAQIPYHTVYLNDGALHDYLVHIQDSPPDWTLSFSNLTCTQTPLCDVMGIPHFLWLEGSFFQAIHFLQTAFGKVGLADEKLSRKLSAKNICYLPQGVAQGVESASTNDPKLYDVVLFADLIDPPLLEKNWEELFAQEGIAKIKRAIELDDPLEAMPYFFYVEQYLNAKKTVHTLTTFQNIALDIFGEHAGNNWLVRLPQTLNLHAQLPFTEHFEVLKTAKIAIVEEESPWFWQAVAADCLPLPPHAARVRHYLAHPAEREESLAQLKQQLVGRSWERQINHLIELMQ